MIEEPTVVRADRVHLLWQHLSGELADIFDAHGVCSILANQIALFTGVTTLVGLDAPQQDYYDVWICSAAGEIKQTRWANETASLEPLIDAGGALTQDRLDIPEPELSASELWQLPRHSILSVPLPVNGRYSPIAPPGILCLIDPPEDCPLNEGNISALATNLTVFLERAHLRNQVHAQDIRFSVISDISYSLTSTLSLKRIFQQLMNPVRRTLNVESLSIGLIDGTSGGIEFVDVLMGPLFQDLPPIRLDKGQGIAGWVAERRESVIVNNVYADERFYARVDHDSGFRTNSMICIPLQVEERVIGVLQAINKQDGDFDESDLLLLQAIGGPLAAAIENAQLHADVIAEKRRIDMIFSNMSEGLMTLNSDGLVTHANDALLSLLRLGPVNVLGQPVGRILRLRSGSLEDFVEQVEVADEIYPQLATDLRPEVGQMVPVLISGAPIKGPNGEVNEMILVFSDLRQIREVERMRDDFFHSIIHELRTPLATILMYARLLRDGKTTELEKVDRFLGIIERESDLLQKMVRQMLQAAKLETREFQRSNERLSVNPILREILPPLADRAIAKGLDFQQRIESELPPIMANQETLDLIFKNLVENAIKFTPEGCIQVEAWHEDGMIFLSVKDDGIGIPPEALPNLFGRFFRSKVAVERGIAGTGLGLYMVKQSVEQLNGTIDVTSAHGDGTLFTVRLPTVTEV